jgi:Protein of unknown function (DUF541)
MMKRLAVLGLMLLPLAASAQVPQSLPSRAFLGGPGGAAGITVQGHGLVKFTVKTLAFVANARGPADEAGALAAMRAAGIDDAAVGPVGSQLYASNATTLRGTIRDVSRAKLDRIAQAAAAYVRAHPGVSLDNVNFFPHADDCPAQEQAARAAAIADARRKAQALAALADVTIEGVLAVNENSVGCPIGDQPFGGAVSFDVTTLTASIGMSESVTFAIVQGGASVRRRTL